VKFTYYLSCFHLNNGDCCVFVLKPVRPETYSFETALQKCVLFGLYLPLEAVLIAFNSLSLA